METDIPILSNSDQIKVHHYILDLIPDFNQRVFQATILFFLEPAVFNDNTDHSSSTKTISQKYVERDADYCHSDGCRIQDFLQRRHGCSEIGHEGNSNVVGDQESVNMCGQISAASVSSKLINCEEKFQDNKEHFELVLDCHHLDVEDVEEVFLPSWIINGNSGNADENVDYGKLPTSIEKLLRVTSGDFEGRNSTYLQCIKLTGQRVKFVSQEWCIRIWKDGVHNARDFPRLIRVKYRTTTRGSSVTWSHDQDGNLCVFSQGSSENNRSLCPSQETAGSLSTWQAFVHVQTQYTVLMSGDHDPLVSMDTNGLQCFYYVLEVPFYCATLVLAIGQWKSIHISTEMPLDMRHLATCDSHSPVTSCQHAVFPCRINCTYQPIIPCKIYCPPSLLPAAIREFQGVIPRYLLAAFHLMGAHPFERLDLVIMPTCFASLGFASPSVSFLSESLLCGDGSMCCRLAHEITHSWFGFSIGAADWNEEWQSEGFATYMEDHIQALARQWSVDEKSQQLDLHARLRYNILKSDLANTDDNLQTLKPSKHIDDDEHIDCIQDGLNPEKWLTQIHHIKGYFLLRYLSKLVGEEIFFQVLQTYIKNFHGNLVPSKKFFDTLFNICPFLHDEGFTIDAIYKDWLDFPGMPFILQNQLPWKQDNPLINEVYTEVEKWKCRDKALRRKRKRKRAKVGHLKTTQLSPAQLVLFLDTLLELNVISTHTLKELDAIYGFCHQNAEIQHRWCELIVKFQFLQKYDDIKSFLINHQSMGVYLYGELTLSGNTHQRQLAEECFSRVKDDMDQVCYKAVWNMIYG